MNTMFAKTVCMFKIYRHREPPIDQSEMSVSTAAFPGTEEPEQIHKGKRRLKENYTNHWDMDYLSRQEIDKLYQKKE
ncbi:MAG: hypothetical protein IPN42_15895 [Methylococcaceae bacterium]|nr:hypothetical protein [Methylococcaceae bacterium]